MSDSELNPAFSWYETNARMVAERHESLDSAIVHGWWLDQLPARPLTVLDIGAGTGRDAAWLSGMGHEVIAVEPVPAMWQEGLHRRPNPSFRWIEDRLPFLNEVSNLRMSFDLILLIAVWMHIAPTDRRLAFSNLVRLLRAGGLIIMAFRPPPAPPADSRAMYPVSKQEIDDLASAHDVQVIASKSEDVSGPDGIVHWTRLSLQWRGK